MFTKVKPIVPADAVKSELPVSIEIKERRLAGIKQIRDILSGDSKRKLFVVGPCSADDPIAVCDYAVRLGKVAQEVKDKIFVVLRVHTAKPRTRGQGYMGLMHTPDPMGEVDFSAGLVAARKLHLQVASESGLCTADEMLYPEAVEYIDDIISYITIGARSAEDQIHRVIASGLDIPVGVKNPTSGNPVDSANSVYAVTVAGDVMFGGYQIKTSGNPYSHAVLRGAVDIGGAFVPNYSAKDVKAVCDLLEADMIRPSVVIDTGHANSGKNPQNVGAVLRSVLADIKADARLFDCIKGFMIESYIRSGCRSIDQSGYGVSITDPCLDFDSTKRLLFDAAEVL